MTIEERAINAFPCAPCSMMQALKELPNLDCSYCNRNERVGDYIKGATEQKQIDIEKAVKYLYANLIYVPEEDNPHVEGSRIENLDMFISDFKKNMLNE